MTTQVKATLAELRDISVPPLEGPSLWPSAGLLLTLVLMAAALFVFLRQRRYPWRRQALGDLKSLKDISIQQRPMALHTLLRRIALALGDDPETARSAQGEQWLVLLNETLRTQYFTSPLMREQSDALYQKSCQKIEDEQVQAIIRIVDKRTRWPW